MSFEYETGGDISVGGGDFLEDAPGTYHFIITNVEDRPFIRYGNDKGQLIEGAAFEIDCSVCAGTVPGQENKSWSNVFKFAKPGSNDEQVARNKVVFDRFFVATGMLKAEDAQAAGKQFNIDLQALVGRQFMATLVKSKDKNKNETKYLTAWEKFFHVDDPAMSAMPKSAQHLKTLHSSLRLIGAQAPKTQPKSNPQPAKVVQQSQPSGGGSLTDDELGAL